MQNPPGSAPCRAVILDQGTDSQGKCVNTADIRVESCQSATLNVDLLVSLGRRNTRLVIGMCIW